MTWLAGVAFLVLLLLCGNVSGQPQPPPPPTPQVPQPQPLPPIDLPALPTPSIPPPPTGPSAPLKTTLNIPQTIAGQQVRIGINLTNSTREPIDNIILEAMPDKGLVHDSGAEKLQLDLGQVNAGNRTILLTLNTSRSGNFPLRINVLRGGKRIESIESIVRVDDVPQPMVMAAPVAVPPGFKFDFKPNTPLSDLLPVPFEGKPRVKAKLVDDVSQVPEVAFQAPFAKKETHKQTAHTLAKIAFLNQKKADGFMEKLLDQRADLAGLPMAMGDACRLKEDRSRHFTQALATVQRARNAGNPRVAPASAELRSTAVPVNVTVAQASQPGGTAVVQQLAINDLVFTALAQSGVRQPFDPESFWEQYGNLCRQEDVANAKLDSVQQEHVTLARIAALMQILGPESSVARKGLVKYLAGISHAEATRALAKLAIFSAEDDVRFAAVDALKVRREKDYTDILVKGLRYPLPAVARRASEAIVKLERNDLTEELVNLLDEPDPRLPVTQDGKTSVREVVRINHHRNCMLCHAPATPGQVPDHATTAQIPLPDQPLPTPSEGYGSNLPDILVRIDVTYLRQDFSMLQPVSEAHPWPEMQRFDFLVRTRTLTEKEVAEYPTAKANELTPYRRAALAALRDLTGKDAAPTPEAWRKLLGL